jgi:hypothetical protein
MGELHLEASFRGGRALAEDFENEPRPVDHLRLRRRFQILLLDRRDRCVDDQQLRARFLDGGGDLLGLALAEQGRGPRRANPEVELAGDVDADRLGKARRLVETRLDIPAGRGAAIGKSDDGACAAGEIRLVTVESGGQALCSSSCASTRSSGLSGCTVEMACL